MNISSPYPAKPTVPLRPSVAGDLLGASIVALGLGISSIPSMLCLSLLLFFLVSPVSLYPNRVQATIVVFVLISGAALVQLVRNDWGPRSKACKALSRAAFLFFGYLTLNCAWSISQGNPWPAALNELVPVGEMCGCFWLATHIEYNPRAARRLVLLVLLLVAARGLWQLVYFVLGKADLLVPPVKSAEEWGAEEVAGYLFARLLDPVSGVHIAVAFALYWTAARGALRFITLLVMGVGIAVLILGLTRAEWIATVISLAVVVVSGKKLGSGTLKRALMALGALLISATLLSLFFQRMSLDLGDILAGRAFTYTQEQLFAPRDSLQSLRFLEIATVTDAFKSAPIFGHGLGSGVGTDVSDGSSYRFVVIHNYYLNMLAKAGLTGIVLLAFLAGRVLQILRKLLKSAEYPMQRAYILMATVGLIWYGILLGFHPIFSAYHIPALLGIYLGIGVSSIHERTQIEVNSGYPDRRPHVPSN